MALILDSSVAVSWAIDSQANQFTRACLVAVIDDGFLVPHHFPIEVAHNLLRAERLRRTSRTEVDIFLLDLKKLSMRLDGPSDLAQIDEILILGRRYMLSGYDAAYLELALRTGLPLATRDAALAAAAEKAGAVLFTP